MMNRNGPVGSIQYAAVIFDAGNTLIVHRPSYKDLFLRFLVEKGVDASRPGAEAFWRRAQLWAGQQTLRELTGSLRMPHVEYLRNYYREAFSGVNGLGKTGDLPTIIDEFMTFSDVEQNWVAIDGVHTVLEQIRDRGVKLGLVSNFDESLPDILKRESLYGYFDSVVVSALVDIEKPDPRIMAVSCRELGVEAADALYVGDHPFDVYCAKEAGLDVVWVSRKDEKIPREVGREPDFHIQAVADLLKVLGWDGGESEPGP